MSSLFWQRRRLKNALKTHTVEQLIDPGVVGFNKMSKDIQRLSIASMSTHCGDGAGDDAEPVGD